MKNNKEKNHYRYKSTFNNFNNMVENHLTNNAVTI